MHVAEEEKMVAAVSVRGRNRRRQALLARTVAHEVRVSHFEFKVVEQLVFGPLDVYELVRRHDLRVATETVEDSLDKHKARVADLLQSLTS